MGFRDTQISMLLRLLSSAMCVQNFDDSRSSAIRITYRISLRSSSLCDPRHPLLKVVIDFTARRDESPKAVYVQLQFQFGNGRHRS